MSSGDKMGKMAAIPFGRRQRKSRAGGPGIDKITLAAVEEYALAPAARRAGRGPVPERNSGSTRLWMARSADLRAH
jgi:hypothetical protein